jgi:hypothetical protein
VLNKFAYFNVILINCLINARITLGTEDLKLFQVDHLNLGSKREMVQAFKYITEHCFVQTALSLHKMPQQQFYHASQKTK